MRRFSLLTAVALALAACQSVPKDYVQFHAGQDATTVARHLSDKVGACWFDGKHKAFDGYSYAPEPGLSSTRILIVPKEEPHGLPVLIVEVLKAKRGTDVRLFGPLMQTGDAEKIRDDIRKWTGGARDC
jgi:hypothetical protein